MDIRAEFLKFFEKHGHKVQESAPLVPDDPTLLFTNAGMVPFKKVFTGEVPVPNPPRAASSQTCIRAGGKHNDLENVGYTNRHHTFFEMLGNFSFGNYFKEEAIKLAWEFVTEVLKLPIDKLWVTVHDSDDEAEEIWKKHIAADRIKRFGDKDNFWQMGDTGPCGPCSEIFYDQGAEHFSSDEDYLGGEGDRFLEIWNLVFMQYERDANGTLTPLPKPSIDTGMGLERALAVKEGVFSNYDTALFMPLINEVAKLCKQTYIYESGASFRVIADHIRSVTFLLAQGVNFDREGRGYVLRRILRRAVRHGYLLGLRKPFMYKLVDTLVTIMGGHYPYLQEKAENVKELIKLEEVRFFDTIASGLELFEKELADTKDIFSGDVAFKLYDTFGFPLDLTEDMLKEKNLTVDHTRFESLMQEQRQRAKAAWKGSGDDATSGDFKLLLEKYAQNTFIGYENINSETKVIALLDEAYRHVTSLPANTHGWVMLEQTPFYAESGGQTGDEGILEGKANVLDTKKFFDLNLSKIETIDAIAQGDVVNAKVSLERKEIAKHHSATHLLHAALKKILGEHVNQAGSLVEKERLRFDFSHPKALSAEEIEALELFVNENIARDIQTMTEVMPVDTAKEKGAMALFGEKYGDEVRVVTMGDTSMELCGGTHVNSSAEIGSFFITKESGVSAGVRRIEAVCGMGAYHYAKGFIKTVAEISHEVKNKAPMLGIKRLRDEIKTLKSDIESLESSTQKEVAGEKVGETELIVDELEAGDIKKVIDELKNQKASVAVMFFQKKGDKVMIAAGVKNASIKAGAWIKAIAPVLGGGGGGRDDFAQAGGKDTSKITFAKEEARAFAKKELLG